MTANMTAWNRWCAVVRAEGCGRLHPVAHLTLRDPEWLEAELDALAGAGVTLAMIGAGRWTAGNCRILSTIGSGPRSSITPSAGLFRVADQVGCSTTGWYSRGSGGSLVPATEAIFLWVPPALALSDLILHGVFDRHAQLRFGVVELSSAWVPQFLMMLDGASVFTALLNGKPVAELSRARQRVLSGPCPGVLVLLREPKQLARRAATCSCSVATIPTPKEPRGR